MILTLEQIYQHYEHIEKITLQSYEMPSFLTHRISLNRVMNSKDYVLIIYPLEDFEDEDEIYSEELFIFAPNTRFEIVWRDYAKKIATSQSAIAMYERLRDESVALQAVLEKGIGDEQG